MRETISASEFQALKGKDRSSVVELPRDSQEDRAAKVRAHLRSMGNYYDIPKDKVEDFIAGLHITPHSPTAVFLGLFAVAVGIPKGPAGFYIRQQELSEVI